MESGENMTYAEFIFEAEKKVINQLDNGTWYLEPEWKDIICREVADNLDEVKDCYLDDWWEVKDVLELEVIRRNAKDDTKMVVIDWLHEIITTQVEPAMLAEETDYIKNVIEFMKANHELS